jgi:hypothetical protein
MRNRPDENPNYEDTGARYNTTFTRLYKDGEKWASTESFGRDDLLLLAKVADQTHTWICAQSQERQASAPAQTPTVKTNG